MAKQVAEARANVVVKSGELFGKSALGWPNVDVTSVEYDSRKVTPGACFVALKGFSTDGRLFVGDAVSRGASVIVTEGDASVDGGDIPVVRVSDVRKELGVLSAKFYGNPSKKLGVVGITGTNGKTTTSYMIQKIFNDAGFQASRFSTTDYDFPDGSLPAPNTTPQSADLQKMFARAVGFSRPRCVMEVSSHGLSLDRLEGTTFKGAVFTNLTQDHLDFHGTMAKYEEAKRRLFTEFENEYAVINIDDPAGARFVSGGVKGKVITFGSAPSATVGLLDFSTGLSGSRVKLATPAGEVALNLSMPGGHNVQNAMAAFAVGIAEGIAVPTIVGALESLKSVPGRFERVDEGQNFGVIVDYAHTDDALAKVLKTARNITKNRLICLFGCGGDRDHGKRPLMGKISAELADVVVVTSDNPRTESPSAIIAEILNGVPCEKSKNVVVVEGREAAINAAVEMAREGDTILLAGKGHEDYQIIGREKFPFDDRKIAAKAVRRRLG
ncbi:MAG: UDP-N-acetylmuramoyl-L-alanyl-D-glutamate--2,6-diaminopimelate ligase [Nitrospinae bacterium]|nr:UDP-N-acetylmuramoyl-L-alanyl-D-glutamate--2,6-diaminopimelate ligase [Nitrospinota bacterium]